MYLHRIIKIPLFFIIVVLISICGFMMTASMSFVKTDDYSVITNTSIKAGASFAQGEIHINESKVPSSFPDTNTILNIITNNQAHYLKTDIISSQLTQYSYDFNRMIIIVLIRNEGNARYLSFTLTQKVQDDCINEVLRSLRNIYAQNGLVPFCISSVKGEYPYALTEESLRNLTDTLTTSLKGYKLKSIISEKTLSITGMSPLLSGINIDNSNFNIGIRSSASENKTYLTIGTPLIINEY